MNTRVWLSLILLFLLGCTALPASSPTGTPDPTPTLAPPQVDTTSVPDSKDAARAFLAAWQAEDYTAMYAHVNPAEQGCYLRG